VPNPRDKICKPANVVFGMAQTAKNLLVSPTEGDVLIRCAEPEYLTEERRLYNGLSAPATVKPGALVSFSGNGDADLLSAASSASAQGIVLGPVKKAPNVGTPVSSTIGPIATQGYAAGNVLVLVGGPAVLDKQYLPQSGDNDPSGSGPYNPGNVAAYTSALLANQIVLIQEPQRQNSYQQK